MWPKRGRLLRVRPPIGVRYGKPVDLEPYYTLPNTKETAAAIVKEIMAAIACLVGTSGLPVAEGHSRET